MEDDSGPDTLEGASQRLAVADVEVNEFHPLPDPPERLKRSHLLSPCHAWLATIGCWARLAWAGGPVKGEGDVVGKGEGRKVVNGAGNEVVDHGHGVARRGERVDHVRADEAGAAGNDGTHQ